MNDWKEQIRQMRHKLKNHDHTASGQSAVKDPSQLSKRPEPSREANRSIHINLGIDFGSSYTKVCYRDIGRDVTGVVRFGTGTIQEVAFVPTLLVVGEDGKVSGPFMPAATRPAGTTIEALKQGLMHPESASRFAAKMKWVTNSPESVYRYLSAWYLSRIISDSREMVKKQLGSNIGTRSPMWSARMGVPIDHYESELRESFTDVLEVAWLMARTPEKETTFSSLEASYKSLQQRLGAEVIDCSVEAELAAEVAAFVTDQHTREGIYTVLDIGGGTLDGTTLEFRRVEGRPKINLLTSRVDELGMESIARRIRTKVTMEDARVALGEHADHLHFSQAEEQKLVQELREHVSRVVVDARRRDPKDWLAEMPYLPLVLCGGGTKSKWHIDEIELTHGAHKHRDAGVPPYHTTQAPVPSDFEVDGIPAELVQRFLVAYGLSLPEGERYDIIGFPRSNPRISPTIAAAEERANRIQMEGYGELL